MKIKLIYPKWPKLEGQTEFHLPPHSVTALRWQDAATGVGDDVHPGGFTLEANARAGGVVDIAYALPAGTEGTLEVRDILGRRIASFPASGARSHRWPAPAPGVYYVLLHSLAHQLIRKVVVPS